MKNIKEIQPILAAIFCINQTSEHKDPDIAMICDYAFRRLMEANTNLLILACVGKSKEAIMPELKEMLRQDTKYIEYLEDYKK